MSFKVTLSRASIIGVITLLLAGCARAAASPTPIPPTSTATKENRPMPSPTAVPTQSPTPTAIPVATPIPKAGDNRVDGWGIEQVWVPAGSFLMGTGDTSNLEPPAWAARILASEQPQHEVTITQGYWLDKYEVTNAAFQAFVEDGGYLNEEFWSEEGWRWLSRKVVEQLPVSCGDEDEANHPRVCITWYEAEAYARWRGGRLPTEAEWEFAARGPQSLIYPWGNEFDESKAKCRRQQRLNTSGQLP
ncbi:MAG: SUMF1/EgtB/PvdO family nonheme iron enzyme [Anaerolineae bacterium]|nr:SUMF1/EgtB/PvdO family nonheme iron enzyme [Anaerolineae bacterium]